MALSDQTFDMTVAEARSTTKESKIEKAESSIKTIISNEGTSKLKTSVTINMEEVSYFITYRDTIFADINDMGYTYEVDHKLLLSDTSNTVSISKDATTAYNAIWDIINDYIDQGLYNKTITFYEKDIPKLTANRDAVKKKLEADNVTVTIKTVEVKNTSTGKTESLVQWQLNVKKAFYIDEAVKIIVRMMYEQMENYKNTLTIEDVSDIMNEKYINEVMDILTNRGCTSVKKTSKTRTENGTKITYYSLSLTFPCVHECIVSWESEPPEGTDPSDYNEAQKASSEYQKNLDTYFSSAFNMIKQQIQSTSKDCKNTCTYNVQEPFISNVSMFNELVNKIKAKGFTVTTSKTLDKETNTITGRALTIKW